ncbi:MAG: DUF2723 domain-containing protein [Myxococcales bacterium]|nr:DUF2723 domain-containing protein [Myxococcales bacterium]
MLAAILLTLSAWALPRAVQAGDAGEFATVMLTGGVPHPSGYPWMRILGLFSRALWALGLSPAVAAALPPTLAGVAAWVLLQRTTARLLAPWLEARQAGALSAALVLLAALSPLVVIHVNDSEVWGPNLLFSVLFARTCLLTSDRGPRPLLLGLLLGLAVSHHLTAVLLVPLAIAGAWPTREVGGPLARFIIALLRNGALGLLGSLLGLLPLLTLPIGAGGGWRWGDVRHVDGLLHHILRRDYGTLSLSLHEEEVSALDTVSRHLTGLGEIFSAGLVEAWWFGALILLGSLGLAAGLLRARSEPSPGTNRIAVGWAAALLIAGPGFASLQNIDPHSPFGAWILERFDLLPLLLLVPVIALATTAVIVRLRAVTDRASIRMAAWALPAVLLLAQFGAVLERGRPATERAVEIAAIDLLENPDPLGPALPGPADQAPIRAIVFGTDDHRSFPVLYAREVLAAGEHTLYIDAALLAHPWYRARLRRRVPTLPDVDKPLRLIGAIWSDPSLDQVPIYLANVFSAPAEKLERVPEGLLWRVVPPADHPRFVAEQWSLSAITERHLDALARLRARPEDFAGRTHPRGHPWSADLLESYREPSRALMTALARAGRVESIPEVERRLEDLIGPPAQTP